MYNETIKKLNKATTKDEVEKLIGDMEEDSYGPDEDGELEITYGRFDRRFNLPEKARIYTFDKEGKLINMDEVY